MPELSFSRALQRALHDAMAADEAVLVLGEDVGHAGGAFGVSRGLLAAYGEHRVRDTPISEAAITGLAVGAALGGLKPVVEIMFMDFVTLAMDALVNQAAKAHFMSGNQCTVPMVLRAPHGGGLGAGPQHSQCLEAWLAHVPGLKVVVPGTVQDAYGLLRAAIDDPNPVVFVEHKALYGVRQSFDPDVPVPAIGQGRIARAGHDLTLVTYGAALGLVEKAAQELCAEGVEAEIVDLRSIQPWDAALVEASVRRTGRVVIVHEAVTPFGAGAEIAAYVAETCFDALRAPVRRIGSAFMPVPFAKALEERYQPAVADVLAAARAVLSRECRQ